MNLCYNLTLPTAPRVPIVISVPHVGTDFPADLVGKFLPEKIQDLDDTDWFLDKLYSFAPSMGITLICAKYHRWVIDLNRQPDAAPLYTDGRVITGLVPTTDFLGNPLYQEGQEPTEADIKARLEAYFYPYHAKIESLLTDLQGEFGEVLLYDAHSIRQLVPSIRSLPFPDMILGTNDEKSASAPLIQVALEALRAGKYQVNHNEPFKGGYITRHFGNPTQKRHALQLERAKIHYMDDTRVAEMQGLLQAMFQRIINVLKPQ
jgi:N-formylglutamate deformylase